MTLNLPLPTSSKSTSILPRSVMHLKAKIRGAIEEALTGLHSSSEKGKQCLTTFDYIVEDVIKDKEAEVSDNIKKTL